MAITIKCEQPECTKVVLGDDRNQALEFLLIHDAQAHSLANKPEKPQRP